MVEVEKVYKVISDNNGMTVYDIADKLKVFPHYVAPCISELVRQDRIIGDRFVKIGKREHLKFIVK